MSGSGVEPLDSPSLTYNAEVAGSSPAAPGSLAISPRAQPPAHCPLRMSARATDVSVDPLSLQCVRAGRRVLRSRRSSDVVGSPAPWLDRATRSSPAGLPIAPTRVVGQAMVIRGDGTPAQEMSST